MQDIYAFDVGDFAKIGLLRHLRRRTGLRVGVLWYKTHLGSAGGDGKHVEYLKQRRYRACDPELWDAMAERFSPTKRTISALCSLFPLGTVFHDTPVPTTDRREPWFQDAKTTVSHADVVFCDPDMGVIFDVRCRSTAHIGLAEISSLFAAGHSLVVYHHLNRSDKHDAQIESALRRFQSEISGLAAAWGAWFRRGTSRVFFVLAQDEHVDRLINAMDEMESAAWCRDRHFVIVPWTSRERITQFGADQFAMIRAPIGNFQVETNVSKALTWRRDDDATPRRPVEQISEGGVVIVVLNDNGGLNF